MSFESKRHALAYLMGVYLSDGSVGTHRGNFGLYVTDEEFRNITAEAMKLVGAKFGLGEYQPRPMTDPVTGKVYDCKRVYRLRERSPYPVGLWLERTFPDGRDHLPLSYITDDIVRDLVAGVMDGDGSIRPREDSGYQLMVCGYSDYLDDLEFLFEDHDVLMYYRPGKINHHINLKTFVKAGFYFRMTRKQTLIEEYKNG